ncbi:MAG: flagellar hook-associated protein, partial [Homoserinimonas sp.]|nr:flagellar hook-associated protein [Homoserinimonas sp.]
MAGLAVDGLVSGMDTTALINSLMQLEAIPQTLLKKKASTTQIMITALQGLNTKVAALATLATAAAKPQALELYSASSTSAKVSVTAGPGAGAGQIDVTVGKLAQAQVTVTGPVTQWPSTSLTITKADLTEVVITAKSTSLNDMV